MRAGRLRQRVTIQETTESRSTRGETSDSWSDVATVYAERRGIQGDERFTADREHAELSHSFRIRHRSDVVPKMRIVEGSRTFDIEAAYDPDGRGRELMILTREAV